MLHRVSHDAYVKDEVLSYIKWSKTRDAGSKSDVNVLIFVLEETRHLKNP